MRVIKLIKRNHQSCIVYVKFKETRCFDEARSSCEFQGITVTSHVETPPDRNIKRRIFLFVCLFLDFQEIIKWAEIRKKVIKIKEEQKKNLEKFISWRGGREGEQQTINIKPPKNVFLKAKSNRTFLKPFSFFL